MKMINWIVVLLVLVFCSGCKLDNPLGSSSSSRCSQDIEVVHSETSPYLSADGAEYQGVGIQVLINGEYVKGVVVVIDGGVVVKVVGAEEEQYQP